jgi:hypothetical protein
VETQTPDEIIPLAEASGTVTASNETIGDIKINEENRPAEVNHGGNIESGKYLYAIIFNNGEANFGKIGILDEEVYVIQYGGLAGVVSDTEKGEYELTEANAKRHNEVLRLLLESNTVIPAEFETVLQSGKVLKQLLEKAGTRITEALRFVENCVELGVKGVIRKDLADTQNDLKATEILEPLKCLAIKSVSGELFSDRLLFNESFLVKKDSIPSFSEEVARLRSMYPMVKLLYSGPWAPYNFIHIRIGKDGIELKNWA